MRAAIFDLDGTLADSAPDITAALNAALADSGLAPFDVPSATALVGAGARTLIERALAARGADLSLALVNTVHARFIAHYERHPCAHTTLYPHVRETLHALTDAGWRIAICTNKPQRLADRVVADLGLASLCPVVIGGRDAIPLKPAAAMVHAAIAALDTSAEHSVFIGDSAADVGAARSAGLPVIILAHGYSDARANSLGANVVLTGFTGMVPILDQLVQWTPLSARPARTSTGEHTS